MDVFKRMLNLEWDVYVISAWTAVSVYGKVSGTLPVSWWWVVGPFAVWFVGIVLINRMFVR